MSDSFSKIERGLKHDDELVRQHVIEELANNKSDEAIIMLIQKCQFEYHPDLKRLIVEALKKHDQEQVLKCFYAAMTSFNKFRP